MKLKFEETKIAEISKQYVPDDKEKDLIQLKDSVISQKYLTSEQLYKVAKWKSPRRAELIKENSEKYIKEITSFSFKANNEKAKIERLTLLSGVGWPTASVILHLFHDGKYPILDFRALWSLSLDVPSQYDFVFWWKYVKCCRSLSDKNKINMRTLDRALWQYSKDNQGKRK